MASQRYFLVIKSDRDVRIAKKPRLAWDEVAVQIDVEFPEQWGKVIGNIRVDAPEFDPTITYVPKED